MAEDLTTSATRPSASDQTPKSLPKGVVLGKDGKPCRTCTSFASWASLTKSQQAGTTSSTTPASTSPSSSSSSSLVSPSDSSDSSISPSPQPPQSSHFHKSLPPDCPPDVEELGRSTWTLLHTLTATYPTTASATEQSDTRQFLSLFSKLYPCWTCAKDFREWMARSENQPRLKGRSEFGNWMCQAHNEVNRKLGKKEFDCSKWEERWKDGWRDGRCD